MSKAKNSGMGSVKYLGGNRLLLAWNPLLAYGFSFECPGKPVGLSGIIKKKEWDLLHYPCGQLAHGAS